MSLDNPDTGPLCGADIPTAPSFQHGYAHRYECHQKSYEAYCERNKRLGRSCPEMKKRCRTAWHRTHCECYTRRTKLHFRLKSWMPKGLNYCGECGKFTKRKRQHNGRCEFSPLGLWNISDRLKVTMASLKSGNASPATGLALEEAHLEQNYGWNGSTIEPWTDLKEDWQTLSPTERAVLGTLWGHWNPKSLIQER